MKSLKFLTLTQFLGFFMWTVDYTENINENMDDTIQEQSNHKITIDKQNLKVNNHW